MAIGTYLGINGVPRKSRIYVGINGSPKKVKKVYVGVNGSPKVVYSSGISKSSFVINITKGRHQVNSGTIGNFALFAGGYEENEGYGIYSSLPTSVLAIDSSMMVSWAPALSMGKTEAKGTKNSEYCIFAGGNNSLSGNSNGVISQSDAYDKLLQKTDLTMYYARWGYATATVGDYALAAGGVTSDYVLSNIINSFDKTLSQKYSGLLLANKYGAGGASVGNFALFAGGVAGNGYETIYVDVINSSLQRASESAKNLPVQSARWRGVQTKEYAIFIAESNTDASCTVAYDENLLQYILPNHPIPRISNLAPVSTKDYAIVAGGYSPLGQYAYRDDVIVYSNDLTFNILTPLRSKKTSVTGEAIGDYIYFFGGHEVNNLSKEVEIYEM